MKPGLDHLLIGIVVLGAGLAITLLSHRYVTYGAIAVGAFEIVRGVYVLWTGPIGAKRRNGNDSHV